MARERSRLFGKKGGLRLPHPAAGGARSARGAGRKLERVEDGELRKVWVGEQGALGAPDRAMGSCGGAATAGATCATRDTTPVVPVAVALSRTGASCFRWGRRAGPWTRVSLRLPQRHRRTLEVTPLLLRTWCHTTRRAAYSTNITRLRCTISSRRGGQLVAPPTTPTPLTPRRPIHTTDFRPTGRGMAPAGAMDARTRRRTAQVRGAEQV